MIWLLCVLTLLFSGCDQKPNETHYREVIIQSAQTESSSVPLAQAAPTDQGMPSDPHAGLNMPAGMQLPVDSAMSQMFSWSVPNGWKQEDGGGMRLATFHLASDEKAIDCSIVSLGGMAGGLEANLRRWMGQIGVKATDDQLANIISSASSLKIKTGQEGKIFDFTTIQSKSKSSDKSMIVVMVNLNEASLFVKMAGTVKTVKKNKDNFFKLAESVEFHAPVSGMANPGAEMNPPTVADPHAGLDMSAMGALIAQTPSQNLISWKSPEGWVEEAGKHMRMATFHQASDPQAIDCSIIALGGPAGGLEANLQRWMGQLGIEPSDDHLNALKTSAESLNTKDNLEIKVFDFTTLQAQGAPADKSMIAAMIPLNQTTVFVKMTGTIESVKKNKDNFLKLLGSITRK